MKNSNLHFDKRNIDCTDTRPSIKIAVKVDDTGFNENDQPIEAANTRDQRGSQVKNSKRISFSANEFDDGNVKFHTLSTDERKALYADTEKFLQTAAVAVEQNRMDEIRRKHQLKEHG